MKFNKFTTGLIYPALLFAMFIALFVVPTFAEARSISGNVEVNDITDHYKVIIDQQPYNVEVCRNVPVAGDKTADALTGAIIGGIIGNNIKGEKNGGTVGALIGGMLGHSNSKATGGTRKQCYVETRFKENQKEVYSHSTITFEYKGKRYSSNFVK